MKYRVLFRVPFIGGVGGWEVYGDFPTRNAAKQGASEFVRGNSHLGVQVSIVEVSSDFEAKGADAQTVGSSAAS